MEGLRVELRGEGDDLRLIQDVRARRETLTYPQIV
jgi:hypothetical protein